MKKNVFVIGLNAFHQAKLERIAGSEDLEFHPLLDASRVFDAVVFDMNELLTDAAAQLDAFDGSVDAIVGYMDFPVSTMVPFLAQPRGLRSPTTTAMLACEHKYWSRLAQREVVAEHVPEFELVDPQKPPAMNELKVDVPFWLKPVKSAGSVLAYRIRSEEDYERAIAAIRPKIGRYAVPFEQVLDRADTPAERPRIGANRCLAEQSLVGSQHTLEGWVQGGEVHIHGAVDSDRAGDALSFSAYRYPSRLPVEVVDRMKDIGRRVLEHVGYDDGCFNVEMFYDAKRDHIGLLEYNTRVAQHHAALFEMVDGRANHQMAVDVALGRKPQMPRGEGKFACAAACFLRQSEDGVVDRVPTAEEREQLRKELGVQIELHVSPGQRLSELVDQDSYSYDLGIMYIGGEDDADIERSRSEALRRAPIVVR